MDKAYKLAFYVTYQPVKRDQYAWGDKVVYESVFDAYFVKYACDGEITNFSDSSFDSDMHGKLFLSGLHIHSWGKTGFDSFWYGYDCTYRNVYSVDMPKATRMLRTLEILQKGMLKIESEQGYHRDLAEYVNRVCRVFKVDKVILRTGESRGDHSYNSQIHVVRNLGDGHNDIMYSLRDIAEQARAKVAP